MTHTHVVIDASALLKLAFAGPLTVAATRIAEHYDLIAPSIIVSECASALWKAVRFADYPQTIAQTNLIDLQSSVSLTEDTKLAEDAFQLACRFGHSVYDCLYLSLAMQEQLPFVSADQKFIRKLLQHSLATPLLTLQDLPADLP